MTQQANIPVSVGATLGDYHLEQLLEQHPIGPIFLASSKAWKTSRIVRFLSAPLRLTPEARMVYLGLFQQEANRVTALKHPNILPLLDYGVYQGMPYLVYPHVPLVSLRALLAQSVPDRPRVISNYLDQLASALEHAHQHAVLHRNLSSANIFMQQHNESVVIAEFGLMYMLEMSRQGLQGQQTPLSSEGSSESIAPEQLQGKRIDTYTDVYALGAVLYRMITGHPPFGGTSREEINQQHLYGEVPSVSTWRKGVPERIDYVIRKAMAKEPLQRFSRPAELADAFHDCIAPNDTGRTPLVVATALAAPGAFQPPASSQPVPAMPSISANSVPRIASVTPGQFAQAQNAPSLSRRRLITTLAVGGSVVVVAGIGGVLILKNKGAGSNTATAGPGSGTAAGNTPTAKATATTPAQPTKAPAGGANVLARSADVPANTAKKFAIAGQNNPGLLIHLPSDTFVAYDSTCTHAGCAVNYDIQQHLLTCPCHGAIFDPAKQGAVVQGPAQTPLTSIKIVVNNDGTITKA